MSLQILREILSKRQGKREQLTEQLTVVKKKEKAGKKELQMLEQALEIVKAVGLETQQSLQYHISGVTTLALESVFEDPYKLVIDFLERRNKSECDIYFEKNGQRIDPLSSSGGGAVDIATFSLRVASWSMQKPRNRPVMILDEPLKNLDSERQEKGAKMLKEVSERMGIQFIIVTHEDSLTAQADRIFTVKQKKGISKVEKL